MKNFKSKSLICVLALALSLSLLSASPQPVHRQLLTQTAEGQVVGGSKCSTAWGLGLALGVAALSPCSVVCAALAWYDLALIGAFCD